MSDRDKSNNVKQRSAKSKKKVSKDMVRRILAVAKILAKAESKANAKTQN